ncbi:hypothetical protein PRUPE_1G181400 [Prunus persica]|uniref:Uncharacterized protein n=1 Tax=Prunus persica TaxID=3760 RepID=A0A251QZ26_PRUPE|nr:hypothetical protein PRUPE_1G181400 [Prunus persica]
MVLGSYSISEQLILSGRPTITFSPLTLFTVSETLIFRAMVIFLLTTSISSQRTPHLLGIVMYKCIKAELITIISYFLPLKAPKQQGNKTQ